MRRALPLTAVGALPLALGLFAASAAMAATSGNSAAARQCQEGGFPDYQRTDGTTFVNEGCAPATPPAVGNWCPSQW